MNILLHTTFKNMRRYKIVFFIGTINCLMFSCIPIIHIKYIADFQNLTQDTLIIGASNYNNIDSMKNFLWSGYDILNHNKFVIKDSIWKGFEMYKYIILPDSICGINEDFLFSQNNDTCYFFLIRLLDAKHYTFDEIHLKKLYKTWPVIKDKNGEFDRNIKKKIE